MGAEDESGESTTLSVDAAFAALGNETRMAILQTIAEDDEPLSFSELRERVGMRDSGQFSYHLDKLDGHFVTKTDDGYELRQSGRYVVEAVLSGAITDNPEIEPTTVDFACLFCGTSVEVSYRQGMVRLSCKGCGTGVNAAEDTEEIEDRNLATFAFPPAGVQGRTATELQEAAATWVHLDAVALSSGVCPRCSAAVDLSIDACADHTRSDGVCDRCGEFRAVRLHYRCRNCIYTAHLAAVMGLLATPELLAFVGEHGLNTTTKGFHWGWEYGEDVYSIEPFEGRFTFEIADDTLALTVDEHLNIIDVTKTTTSELV